MANLLTYEKFLNETSFLKIGIYYDKGVTQNTIAVWSNFFRKYFGSEPIQCGTGDFVYKKIKGYDLVVVPGGKGYEESLGMTEDDKEGLKQFVSEGGKLLAVCAGAFLVTQDDSWSLNMVDITQDVSKKPHLSDEILELDFNVTEKGQEIFNTRLDTIKLRYHGGPVMVDVGNVDILLTFASEVPHDTKIQNFSKGLIAATYSAYGKGKILAISPHIEKTESGFRPWIRSDKEFKFMYERDAVAFALKWS